MDWTTVFFLAQAFAAGLVLKRLLPGRCRRPPLRYAPPGAIFKGSLAVVVPARNEENRIGDCLHRIAALGDEVAEILVVDDQSSDGTAAVARSVPDRRIKIIRGAPLPAGWVGKAWALEQGLKAAKTEWVLCLDADTRPDPGLASMALRAAEEDRMDLLFVGPRFLVDGAGQQWLHPALLTTLIYRLGPGDVWAGSRSGKRQMISGPCFLFRREVMLKSGGFYPARGAFAEDAVMAAHLSSRGHRVGFRDGAPLLAVKMYDSLRQTWSGWGISLALREVRPPVLQAYDLLTLAFTQAAPLPVLLGLAASFPHLGPLAWSLMALNGFLFLVRIAILRATAGSYAPTGGAYWLSPLADIPAVVRVFLSAIHPPRAWRGRTYQQRRGSKT